MTFKRGTITIGIRERIKQEVAEVGFYNRNKDGEYTDIELLRFVASEGKEEWFDFLIKEGGFFDPKGKIRKEYAGQFDECIIFAVNQGHTVIARKLFGMGAKVRYYLNDSLQYAIMKNQYDLAELCFDMGAKIRVKYQIIDCLEKADDKMVSIIEKHRESIVFMLVKDSPSIVMELLEKRKNRWK